MALRLHPEVRGGGDPFLFAGIRKYWAGSEGGRLKARSAFPETWSVRDGSAQRTAIWMRLFSTPFQPAHRHDRAEPLRPGEILPASIALRATCHAFP